MILLSWLLVLLLNRGLVVLNSILLSLSVYLGSSALIVHSILKIRVYLSSGSLIIVCVLISSIDLRCVSVITCGILISSIDLCNSSLLIWCILCSRIDLCSGSLVIHWTIICWLSLSGRFLLLILILSLTILTCTYHDYIPTVIHISQISFSLILLIHH